MKQQPVSMIGHYVDADKFEQFHALGQQFVSACMTNHFVLTREEQLTLFGLIQRIEHCCWEHGLSPVTDTITPEAAQARHTDTVWSPRLQELLNTIRKHK